MIAQKNELSATVEDAFMNIILRYRWHVLLYEWYLDDTDSSDPLVLDADDLMYSRDAVAELCRRTGLDFARVKYAWEMAADAQATTESYAREHIFLDTLVSSTGILPGKGSKGINVDAESKKWIAEFGRERGDKLRQMVEQAMPDYLFLTERRVTG